MFKEYTFGHLFEYLEGVPYTIFAATLPGGGATLQLCDGVVRLLVFDVTPFRYSHALQSNRYWTIQKVVKEHPLHTGGTCTLHTHTPINLCSFLMLFTTKIFYQTGI